jgi:hypothetical protein
MARKKTPTPAPAPIRIPLGHGLVALITYQDDRAHPTDNDRKEKCA